MFRIPDLEISIWLIFAGGKKQQPPIIGATCAFDAKIYKIVGGIFNVSACGKGNKKKFKNSDFCFQLPSLLIAQTLRNFDLAQSLS